MAERVWKSEVGQALPPGYGCLKLARARVRRRKARRKVRLEIVAIWAAFAAAVLILAPAASLLAGPG